MDRLLARLERRFGRYALDNVTWYLVGLQGFVFAVTLVKPELLEALSLDPHKVIAEHQYHRLVTWLFIPISTSPIWVLFALYFLHTMGTALEGQWGAFRYQVYWLIGAVGTLVAGFALDAPIDNRYLMMSLFLAFATLWPDYEIMLFMIVPIRVKWLAYLDAAVLLGQIGTLPGWQRIIPLVAVANYLLFFGRALLDGLGKRSAEAGRARARRRFDTRSAEGVRQRVCARCGVTSADPAVEFRVCDCERCGGKATDFCLPHALEHVAPDAPPSP